MKIKSLILAIFFIAIHFHVFAQISINITSPAFNKIVGNTLFVQAVVNSIQPVPNVIAVTNGRQTNLTNGSPSNYTGTISLVGLHEGDTLQLAVTATDVLNNQQTATRQFIYDEPPVVLTNSPLDETVARPGLPVNLRLLESDTCTVQIVFPSGVYPPNVIYTGKVKDSLQLNLNLSAYNGTYGTLAINVTDRLNQQTFITRKIYIESSPLLREFFVSNTKIFDFNYTKVLVPGDSSLSNPRIIDVNNNQITTIPLKVELQTTAFITPHGAIFGGVNAAYPGVQPTYTWGFDWNEGLIYSLGRLNGSTSLKAAGEHAIWSNDTTMYYRNMVMKTITTVPISTINFKNDVAPNGLVAFGSSNYNIYTYVNGSTNLLTNNNDNKWNTYPITNGKDVVYSKQDPCCGTQNYSLYLFDGSSHTELANHGTLQTDPGPNYQLTDKFIAFTKPDNAGFIQVWLRDSAGNFKQITFVGNPLPGNNEIDFLSPKGDVFYTTAAPFLRVAKRFVYLHTGQTIEITPLGKTYYSDSTFYIAMGRSLFTLNIQQGALPVKLLDFTAEKKGSKNLLQWSAMEDNDLNYTDIEKSNDGTNFKSIGQVSSSQRMGIVHNSFTDNEPYLSYNYYRLKFISHGGYEYSPVKIINNAQNWIVQLFPNPVTNNLSIKMESDKKIEVYVSVWSAEGKMALHFTQPCEKGTTIKKIAVAFLPKGSYVLKTSTANKESAELKFVKL